MKKYLLGLFAIVLAIGFSAFTTKSTTLDFFAYSGSGDQDVAANYDLASISCGSTNSVTCGIWGINDGNDQPTQASVNDAKSAAGNYSETTETFGAEVSGVVEFKP